MKGLRNLLPHRSRPSIGGGSSSGDPSFTPGPSEQTLPGDSHRKRVKGQKVTSEEIRALRELIRQRYAKDIQIWSKRDVLPANRKIVEHWLAQADTLLIKINSIIDDMDSRKLFDSDEDWEKFCQIKKRIRAPGKREWCKDKPWS